MTQRNIFSILGILVLIGSCLWLFSRSVSQNPAVVSIGTGLVSDLASPFGSGGSNKTLFDTTPTQPIWETSSGATIYYNTNWMGRTVEIHGKPVHYQFGSGNPVETDKSVQEIAEIYKKCMGNCDGLTGPHEFVSSITLSDGSDGLSNPSRVTPELERLLYEFLSNPILRQSSESCGDKFFTYDQAYSVFGSTIGETQSQDWWDPYRIDINTYITINPNTGRKELNMMPMYTLRQQLNIPSELVGGTWWSNIPLRDCLQKNKQLTYLLNHVNLYTDKLSHEYRS
jgi:hypothetical protein